MITANALTKVYDDVAAVKEVSVEVGRGQTLGLIGPNGAGKTTLLRMLATLAKPDEGTIEIAGYDAVHEPREIRRRLGFMPAEFGVPRDMNMREYMRYFACLAGLSREERDAAIDQALELTDLRGRDDVMVGGLSTGNKQRLLLAKTLIHDPELLILDEPSSGLDPRARVEVREILQELAGLGKTIVISSHILKDLESICTHVVIMEAGQVALAGDVLELKEQLRSSDRRVKIRVPVESVDAAKALLTGMDEVIACEAEKEGWLDVSGSEQNCNGLLRALLDADMEVLGLVEQTSDLESIFIQSDERPGDMSSVGVKMKGLVQGWHDMANSPTWERDAATITSPWRMGMWFLILNLLIVAGLVSVYAIVSSISSYDESSAVLANMGLGRLFSGAIFLALTFFLSVFVPIRVFGVFVGPRTGRYFDQIVLSGITPWRFVAGKIRGVQAFYGVVMVVSLPYFLLCLSFGGVSFLEVLLCATLLFVYVHVLVVATLAASTLVSEIMALPLVIGAFLASAAFGLAPLGPHPLSLTPASTIMGMLYQEFIGVLGMPSHSFLLGSFRGLTLVQSHVLLYGVISGVILALGGLAVMLGPISALSLGLNTFGEAVLPGDRKRSGWLKRRFDLRRQSELSFLYENGSKSWRAADFRFRWLLRELVFVFLIGVALIWLYWWFTTPKYVTSFYGFHLLFCIAALAINAVLFSDTWVSDRLTLGRWEAGNLNLGCFLFNVALVWLAFGWWPYHMELDLAPSMNGHGEPFVSWEIQERNFVLVSLIAIISMTFYAALRLLSLGPRSKAGCALFALLLMLVLGFVPAWLQLLANIQTLPEDPIKAPWLLMASPFFMIQAFMDTVDLSEEDGILGLWWCGGYYLTAAVIIGMITWRKRQRLPRRML